MDERIAVIKQWLLSGSINLFGLPMSGKDTQGKKLAEALGAELIGGGAILRGDNMPGKIKKAMGTGKLISTDDYLSIVMPHLLKQANNNKPLILSSIGRRSGEEDSVILATAHSGHPLKAVVYLKLSEKQIMDRLKKSTEIGDRGKRKDDSEAKMVIRLKEYEDKTKPVLETYSELGVVIEIDASGSREQVYQKIIDGLFKFASRALASQ